MTRPVLTLPLLLSLTACPNMSATQQASLASLIQGAVTLGATAAQNNTTAERIVGAGQLLCASQGLIAAVAGVNVTGLAAQSVAAVCAGIGATPTALPVGVAAASVPVVAAPAVALVAAKP